MAEDLDAQQLWEDMTQLLHEGDLNPRLWDAVDAVTPLVVDEGTVIVGLEPAQMQHAGYIETGQNKAYLQDLLEQITGRRLDIRVISGTTVASWERTKRREAAGIDEAVAQVQTRVAEKGAREIWRQGLEKVVEIFIGSRARARGTDLARLMAKALAKTYEVEQAARAEAPDDEELHNQQVNRIIDRIATYCNVSSTVVALEYLRYCREQH